MSHRKQAIIERVRTMLRPAEEKLCMYFVQSEKHPGKWTHEGKLYTREEALMVKARRTYFINIARRTTPIPTR